MHLYQPLDFGLGLIMSLLGLIGLGYDLSRVFSRTFTNTYAGWRSVSLSVWFTFDGPAHCSKAFDPRHQESHLTSVLTMLAILTASVLLAANGIAWLIRRRQAAELSALKTSSYLEQRAARGDRGKFEQAMAKVGGGLADEWDRL